MKWSVNASLFCAPFSPFFSVSLSLSLFPLFIPFFFPALFLPPMVVARRCACVCLSVRAGRFLSVAVGL